MAFHISKDQSQNSESRAPAHSLLPRPHPLAQAIRAGLLLGAASLALPNQVLAFCPPDITSAVSTGADETINGGDTCNITNTGSLINVEPHTLSNFGTLNSDGFISNEFGASLSNAGTLTNWSELRNSGRLINESGGTLTNNYRLYNNSGASLDNSGTLSGGFLKNWGSLSNHSGGTLIASIDNFSRLSNAGTMTGIFFYNVTGASLSNAGTLGSESLTNSGSLSNQAGGTLNNSFLFVNHSDATLSNAGILTSSYLFNDGSLSNQAGGTLNSDDWLSNGFYARLENAGTLNSAGLFENRSLASLSNTGTLNSDGALHNDPGASLSNSGALNINGLLYNRFASSLSNTGTLTNSGLLDNNGTLTNQSGALLVNNGQIDNTWMLEVAAGGSVNGSGTLTQTAGILDVDGTVTQSAVGCLGGTLKGTGSLSTLNVNGCTVAPGHSPGILTVDGDFTFTSGILKIEIGGLAAGQYDRLDITGAANFLGGTIEFDFIDGFLPTANDTFAFLAAGSLDGLGNMLFTYTGLAPGFDFSITPGGGSLLFTALNDGQPVPEIDAGSGTGALTLLLGALGLLGERRRKSGSAKSAARRAT